MAEEIFGIDVAQDATLGEVVSKVLGSPRRLGRSGRAPQLRRSGFWVRLTSGSGDNYSGRLVYQEGGSWANEAGDDAVVENLHPSNPAPALRVGVDDGERVWAWLEEVTNEGVVHHGFYYPRTATLTVVTAVGACVSGVMPITTETIRILDQADEEGDE